MFETSFLQNYTSYFFLLLPKERIIIDYSIVYNKLVLKNGIRTDIGFFDRILDKTVHLGPITWLLNTPGKRAISLPAGNKSTASGAIYARSSVIFPHRMAFVWGRLMQ